MNAPEELEALAAEADSMSHNMGNPGPTRLRLREFAEQSRALAAQLRQRESEAVAEVARESMWGERCVHWIRNDNDDGKDLLMGTKLYLAAPSDDAALKDAARYRWLRDPTIAVGSAMEKVTGHLPSGFPIYEYRSGEELDAAIDAALAQNAPERKS